MVISKDKAKALASAKKPKNRENEVANLRAGYERHHALWVDTVKSVAGTDIEALLAAVFELIWLGSRGADRAQVARNIDVKK